MLPGLIDMHVHLAGDPGGDFWRRGGRHATNMQALIGRQERAHHRCAPASPRCATSARRRRSASRSRRGTAEGLFPGPRIVASGPAISIVGGHGDVNGFRPEVIEALGGRQHLHRRRCNAPSGCASSPAPARR